MAVDLTGQNKDPLNIKRSVRRQVEDLQEDSDKFFRKYRKPRYTCTEKIYMSQFNLNITQPVECSLITNSPDQCDTGSSIMSITENDLCEKDGTLVTCSDETLNVPMEAAEVLF